MLLDCLHVTKKTTSNLQGNKCNKNVLAGQEAVKMLLSLIVLQANFYNSLWKGWMDFSFSTLHA